MEMESIISLIVNNSVAVSLLAYFVYRDNKFMTNLEVTLKTLQTTVDSVQKMVEKEIEKEEAKK